MCVGAAHAMRLELKQKFQGMAVEFATLKEQAETRDAELGIPSDVELRLVACLGIREHYGCVGGGRYLHH